MTEDRFKIAVRNEFKLFRFIFISEIFFAFIRFFEHFRVVEDHTAPLVEKRRFRREFSRIFKDIEGFEKRLCSVDPLKFAVETVIHHSRGKRPRIEQFFARRCQNIEVKRQLNIFAAVYIEK